MDYLEKDSWIALSRTCKNLHASVGVEKEKRDQEWQKVRTKFFLADQSPDEIYLTCIRQRRNDILIVAARAFRMDPNKTLSDGRSCFHWAVHDSSSLEMPLIKALVACGASITSPTEGGCTPLHYAATSYNLVLCQFLIERKADVNALTKSGHTPLHYAARAGRENMLVYNYLLSKGANPDLRDNLSCKKALEYLEQDLFFS